MNLFVYAHFHVLLISFSFRSILIHMYRGLLHEDGAGIFISFCCFNLAVFAFNRVVCKSADQIDFKPAIRFDFLYNRP
ncbi:Uncharacterised protein [Mycobacteroides abscessus subsp. abscessus]|nr:Uncharacterised protein [Mycobacteroides abscessus subsp. abscessus]